MSDPTLNFHIQTSLTQFQVPTELIKKNFKNVQKLIEKQKKQVTNELSSIKKNPNLPASMKLEMIRKVIKGFENFEKRLKQSINKDEEYRSRIQARLENLEQLATFTIGLPTVTETTNDKLDPKKITKEEEKTVENDDKVLDLHNNNLINWYRDQANLLIIDYLIKSNLKTGSSVGLKLLKELSLSNPKYMKLIDYDLLETFNTVFISIIEKHDLTLVTAWFDDNRTALKKISSNLDFEINYCRFLSYVEQGETDEAIKYSQQYLSPSGNIANYQPTEKENYNHNMTKLKEIGGLLVYLAVSQAKSELDTLSSSQVRHSQRYHEYQKLLSDERWKNVSECFMDNFTKLYGISKNYPLFIYLSAGLSSLKTKSCYCNNENTIFVDGASEVPSFLSLNDRKFRGPNHYYKMLSKINNCPVCSPELFKISRNLPYAQLITSIFNNPYKLPNGNIYPIEKLVTLDEIKNKLDSTSVVDPLTHEIFQLSECVRVYPA